MNVGGVKKKNAFRFSLQTIFIHFSLKKYRPLSLKQKCGSLKGSDRLCMVVELSMQYCGQIL